MKRLPFLFFAVAGGCSGHSEILDNGPFAYRDYVWENRSGHAVVFGYNNSSSFELKPSESVTDHTIMSIDPPSREITYFWLTFDGDSREVFYINKNFPWENGAVRLPANYDAQFDPTLDENYRHEAFVDENGLTSHRWIYAFTDEDYQAAQGWAAKEQE